MNAAHPFRFAPILLTCALATPACRATTQGSEAAGKGAERGPVVEHYSASDRVRSGIALGGLGTGGVELRKNGQFYNWTLFNNQPLGTGPVFDFATYPNDGVLESMQFFLVRYQEAGGDVKLKLLQLNDSLNEAAIRGIAYEFPWMTAVRNIEYSGRFPFVNMKFSDPEMPFEIHLEAFTPFIPHDATNSSLPGAYLNFKVVATGKKPVNVMLIATQRNAVGYDTQKKHFVSDVVKGPDYLFVSQGAGMDTAAASYGQMGLFSMAADTTYHAGWEHRHPYYERLLVENRLRNENATDVRNKVHPVTGEKFAAMGYNNKDQRAFSSLAITRDLQPGGSFSHTYGMAWFFPNAYGSHNEERQIPKGHERLREFPGNYTFGQKITKDQGHFYERQFGSASDVAKYLVAQREDLSRRTHAFVNDFYDSDAPLFVLDQINSQLNTFVTSSTFTQDGKFGIREGMTVEQSWGPNVTIDVSLYGSSAIINLFPELQKSSMRAHRARQTKEGEIAHGLGYDLDFTQNGTWGVYHRIDMPGNYIQLVLRDYFHTNDRAFLEEMWPSLKAAVQYVLSKRDEDKDMMPDMTGIMCSYDNFPMYGLASYIQSQWLAAMRSMMVAAEEMKDTEALARYREIYETGARLMDQHLWNGEYYILSKDYTGLAKNEEGATKQDDGILTDQIIGQWIAHQSGLGYLFKEANVKKALRKIMQASFNKGLGLRNASWPEHPKHFPLHETNLWVDQANTAWTGVELGFASFLLYEGFYEDALTVIRDVDERYRSAGLYWDHQEFGGHYYRPMAAWQVVNALLGLSINRGTYRFAPKLPRDAFKLFFAFNGGTAHYIKHAKGVTIDVRSGVFSPKALEVPAAGLGSSPALYIDGRPTSAQVSREGDSLRVALPAGAEVKQGQRLELR